jgi:hypothetical protein
MFTCLQAMFTKDSLQVLQEKGIEQPPLSQCSSSCRLTKTGGKIGIVNAVNFSFPFWLSVCGGAKHVRNEWGKKLSGERLSQGKRTAHLSVQSRGKRGEINRVIRQLL